MLEREMEDLIAAAPNHFFPRYGFELKGRQQSFHGVGRFDLLFADRHGMNVLMELKAVPAKYDVIDQIAKYRDANFVMWIIAPSIPVGLREFLSHLGIEYTEIHESEFRRVASLIGYKFSAEQPLKASIPEYIPTQGFENSAASIFPVKNGESSTGISEWGFGESTQPTFLLRALESGGKTKEQIRSAFISHFYPDLEIADARSKSGFNVFFSDSRRPVGTYHASRALVIVEDSEGRLSLDEARAAQVKSAIKRGILQQLRGLHFQRNKSQFDEVQHRFNLPTEL